MPDQPPKPMAVSPPPDPPKPKPKPKAKTGKPAGRPKSLESRLEALILGMAGMPAVMGDWYTATIITNAAPDLAKAWADLAAENVVVKRWLEKLTEVSVYGNLIYVTAGVALPILAHHGILPVPAGSIIKDYIPEQSDNGGSPTTAVRPPAPPDAAA